MPAEAATRAPELYSRELLRLAAELPHGDRLCEASATATRRSPVCGSEISADVMLDRWGSIEGLAFRARACAMGQASAALLRTTGLGKTGKQIAETRERLAHALAGTVEFDELWPELAVFEPARSHPGRHAAILLPYDTVLAALEDG